MGERLCSVGIDVGTTTTQLVVSVLTVENRASGFAVPHMDITDREVVYESPVHFTPLLGKDLVDARALASLVQKEYRNAGITPADVDTGAVIITGETSRKENAAAVVEHLSRLAGDFVVATAGPDLESALAAKGAGATVFSEKSGKRVLHMDIGGGTSNLALIENGQVVKTGCLNVGGRLIKLEQGAIIYMSPVLKDLTSLQVGDIPTRQQLFDIAQLLARALETAAGLRPADEAYHSLLTREAAPWRPESAQVISFSGGVADCIEKEVPWDAYGDIGPLLGQAIRESHLCKQEYRLGKHTIRATVMGAGCYSTQLSGSTVYRKGIDLPVKGLPAVVFSKQTRVTAEEIARCFSTLDGCGVLAMPGISSPSYGQVRQLAQTILQGIPQGPLYICIEEDHAKALGQALALLAPGRNCICLDNLKLQEDSFLDIGLPVGPALPVVIKTLVL